MNPSARFFRTFRGFTKSVFSVISRGGTYFVALIWLVGRVLLGQLRVSWSGKSAHIFDSVVVTVWASGFAEIELLRSQHFSGVWRSVRETPHYAFARGAIEGLGDGGRAYEDYMIARRPRSPQELGDKSEKFLEMIAKIQAGQEFPPVVLQLKPGFLGIVDGSHRSSTYAALQDLSGRHGRVPFVLAIGEPRRSAC